MWFVVTLYYRDTDTDRYHVFFLIIGLESMEVLYYDL